MASFFRRAGTEILRVIRSAAVPSPSGTNGILYGILSDGQTRLFTKDSGGTAFNISTALQQRMLSPKYDGAAANVLLAANAAKAIFMGYAYRDFAIGEVFTAGWRMAVTGANITWGEIAVGTGAWTAGSAPTITPISFTSVATPMGADSATNEVTTITLVTAIPKGRGLWVIFAEANGTTAPQLNAGPIDLDGVGVFVGNATGGWRPSAQLGVATAFTIDSSSAVIKAALSPPA